MVESRLSNIPFKLCWPLPNTYHDFLLIVLGYFIIPVNSFLSFSLRSVILNFQGYFVCVMYVLPGTTLFFLNPVCHYEVWS